MKSDHGKNFCGFTKKDWDSNNEFIESSNTYVSFFSYQRERLLGNMMGNMPFTVIDRMG
jgi:hypothetical protein